MTLTSLPRDRRTSPDGELFQASPSPQAPGLADEYVSFCEGIRALARIDLLQYKRGQMERRIRSFAQRRGVEQLPDYLARLQRDRAELDEFLDRVTINVSQLWRNPEQWSVLEQHVLPELLAQRGSVKAWSAGCSYGAEAYTLAALACELHDRQRRIGRARVEVLGTDIDRRMVQRARRGRFSAEDARSAPPQKLARWFERDGEAWQASRALQALVSFELGDLLRLQPRREAYDLVLCRNTVIYFTEDVRDALHERLVASLRPGGYLVIGATERVSQPHELGLLATHPFTYRKS